jgi:hypothetical protein
MKTAYLDTRKFNGGNLFKVNLSVLGSIGKRNAIKYKGKAVDSNGDLCDKYEVPNEKGQSFLIKYDAYGYAINIEII